MFAISKKILQLCWSR